MEVNSMRMSTAVTLRGTRFEATAIEAVDGEHWALVEIDDRSAWNKEIGWFRSLESAVQEARSRTDFEGGDTTGFVRYGAWLKHVTEWRWIASGRLADSETMQVVARRVRRYLATPEGKAG